MKGLTLILALILLASAITGCAAPAQVGMADLQIDTQAQVDAEIEREVKEAAELLQQHGSASQEIWPGYDLSRNAIIVCVRDDETNAVVRAWKLTTLGLTELTNEDLAGTEIPAAGNYNSTVFEGRKSIIIAINREKLPGLKKVAITNAVYEVGVHEMYHFHYESMLKLMKLGMEQKRHGGRGTAFPKAAEPRVYRKMLYDNLAAAFEYPGEEELYLGRAKYWYEKWKNEFPEEYYQAKVTDIMEGKARYIQYMLCMPEGLSDEEQAAWIGERFDRSPEPAVSMDSESYRLGFAAGVLLDRRDPDWKKQVTKQSIPPVEYLLKNVEIVEDDGGTYAEKLETAEEQMAQINEELTGKLENIRAAEADVGIPLLQMSQKYMAGSFETSDFLNYQGKSLVVDFGATFESKNGRAVISGLSVYEPGKAYLLPLTMPYELRDGRLVIDCDEVSCDIQVKQTVDNSGRTVYEMK